MTWGIVLLILGIIIISSRLLLAQLITAGEQQCGITRPYIPHIYMACKCLIAMQRSSNNILISLWYLHRHVFCSGSLIQNGRSRTQMQCWIMPQLEPNLCFTISTGSVPASAQGTDCPLQGRIQFNQLSWNQLYGVHANAHTESAGQAHNPASPTYNHRDNHHHTSPTYNLQPSLSNQPTNQPTNRPYSNLQPTNRVDSSCESHQ